MALSYIATNILKCVLKEHIEIEVLYFLNILFKLKLLCFHNMCIFFPISLSVKKTEFAVYVAIQLYLSKASQALTVTLCVRQPFNKESSIVCSSNGQFI